MAPEQILGHELGPETDLFCFGVVLFEMLCGRLPFADSGKSVKDMALCRLHQRAVPPSQFRPGLSRELDEVVLRCLRFKPIERYASASDALAALLECGDEQQPRE